MTFLFTDVEGSVRLWAADVAGTAKSFELHDRLVRRSIEESNGTVFGTAGDSFRGVFTDATDAISAAQQCQQQLAEMSWDSGPELRVRIGIHRGPATARDADFLGPVPNTAARVEALGHGGQILMTSAVHDEVDRECLWLGEYRLRDVPEPLSIFQVNEKRFPPLRHIDPALSSLPRLGPELVGRQLDVAYVREALRHNHVVTLTGYGGSGKTRLALEVAHQELPSRADGCYFVDLSAVGDEAEFPAAVATAIRLTLNSGDPTEQILSNLASRDALLVLDNCEHLVEICGEFAELVLERCDAKLLVTSQQRLDIAGERVVLVDPLGHDAIDSPAVQLFVERSQQPEQNAPRTYSEAELRTIQEICTRLDGIPLAIELAAARVSVLSPAELLARMEDRFRLLSGGRRRRKRRTLLATLDWSYGLLEADEQQLFRRCGVFSGSFDLPAACAVSELGEFQTLDLLQSLVTKSLISRAPDHDHPRFRLLETVRVYAHNRLDEAGALQAARDLHLGHFNHFVSTDCWGEANDIDRSKVLAQDWSNISNALEWAATNNSWMVAADMTVGCQGLWEHQVPATEGQRWIEQILPQLEARPPGTSTPERRLRRRDQLTMNLALLAMQLDDHATMHTSLSKLGEDSHPSVGGQALAYRAFTRLRHNPAAAQELLTKSEEMIERHALGSEVQIPALWVHGVQLLYRAEFVAADPLLRMAANLAKTSGANNTHVVISGLAYASNLVLLGRPTEAIELLDGGSWESVWDSSDIVRALALIDLGEVAAAADLVVEFGNDALLGRLARKSNDALIGLARLALSRGEEDRCWDLLQKAVTPRTPSSITLAEGLADRIGRGQELRASHRNRTVPVSELDASQSLKVELIRLDA